jgi:hypothetical protein
LSNEREYDKSKYICFQDTIEGGIHLDGGVSIHSEATVERGITIFRNKRGHEYRACPQDDNELLPRNNSCKLTSGNYCLKIKGGD